MFKTRTNCFANCTFSLEKPVSGQNRLGCGQDLFPNPTATHEETEPSRCVSRPAGLGLHEGCLFILSQEQSTPSCWSTASLGEYEKATLSNLDEHKHLDSRAFRPRLHKAIQPSDPAGDLLPPTQTDLPKAKEDSASQSKNSAVSQSSDNSHELLPGFEIRYDSDSDISRKPSITPKSFPHLHHLEGEDCRSNRIPIDTNIDIIPHLEKNSNLLEFHREKSTGSPANRSPGIKTSQRSIRNKFLTQL